MIVGRTVGIMTVPLAVIGDYMIISYFRVGGPDVKLQ